MIDMGHSQDPHAEIEGMKFLTTEDGQRVNDLGDGRYLVVATGEILTPVVS